MAYVAISGDLVSRVRDKIDKMRRQELNTLGQKPDRDYDPNDPYLLSLMWDEHIHLKDILPAKFMSTTANISFKYFGAHKNLDWSRQYIYFKGEMLTPPHASNNLHHEVDLTQPVFEKLCKWLEAEDEIDSRWNKTEKDISDFLQNCKSLNEALKLWPGLEAYIQSFDLERVNTKKEKQEKSNAALEALKALDTDALVANAVIARMSGG